MAFADNQVTAIIGPSGCGKSTLLRSSTGCTTCIRAIAYRADAPVPRRQEHRRPGGRSHRDAAAHRMVFQKPNPIPEVDLRKRGLRSALRGEEAKADSPRRSSCPALCGAMEEVKDRLQSRPYELSGGQQQRLCIARALAIASGNPLVSTSRPRPWTRWPPPISRIDRLPQTARDT